jgi:hypothetical protein
MPYANPIVVGAARNWDEMFDIADDLYRKGQLTDLGFYRSEDYAGLKDFRVALLHELGDPIAQLQRMRVLSPEVHFHARSFSLYLCEGRVVTPRGTEPCWRLDVVYS